MKIRFRYVEVAIIIANVTVAVFLLSILKLLYFLNNGDLFAFNAVDSLKYDAIARNFNFRNLQLTAENLDKFRLGRSDYGAPILTYLIYSIYPSPLLFSFFNFIWTLLSSILLVRICRGFLSNYYCKLLALMWGLSQFVIYQNSTSLKESFLVMLVLISFYFYRSWLSKDLTFPFLGLLMTLGVIVYFRPIIVILLVASYGFGYLHIIKSKKIKSFILFTLLIMGIIFIGVISSIITPYLMDYNTLLKQQGLQEIGLLSYPIMLLSGFVGPLPTFFLGELPKISLYSGSLFVRMILSGFMLMGIVNSFKIKSKINKALLLAMLAFTFSETLALVAVLDALELRKSFPHYQFFYVLIVFGIQEMKLSNRSLRISFRVFQVSMIVLIFFWNLLRM